MSYSIRVKNKIKKDEIIKISPFKKEIRKTMPHKHENYFEIIYLNKGEGIHCIDFQKYPIVPPVIFFIRKEQVHYWELGEDADGFVLIIRRLFMQKSLDNELKNLFEKISSQNCLMLRDTWTIQILFEILTEENKGNNENKFHIIEGLLKSLLAKVLEVATPVIEKEQTHQELFHSFISLLHENNRVSNKVNFYAKQLNTSPQNLNAVCRKAINQPASAVLAEFIINEAKRLLLYTDKTISEISYELEFNDPSHFVKYFKKVTAQTPKAFRLNS